MLDLATCTLTPVAVLGADLGGGGGTDPDGFLLSEWNVDNVHRFDPVSGDNAVFHTAQLNDADCNAAEGSDLAWWASTAPTRSAPSSRVTAAGSRSWSARRIA